MDKKILTCQRFVRNPNWRNLNTPIDYQIDEFMNETDGFELVNIAYAITEQDNNTGIPFESVLIFYKRNPHEDGT